MLTFIIIYLHFLTFIPRSLPLIMSMTNSSNKENAFKHIRGNGFLMEIFI